MEENTEIQNPIVPLGEKSILDAANELRTPQTTVPFQAQPKSISINKQLVGDYTTGTPKPTTNNSEAHANALGDYIGQAGAWANDKSFWGKSYAYGAGSNDQHFERYYTDPKFSKLGFNPYRDNEAFYNQNTTLMDDARRGFVPVMKLLGSAFVSPFASSDWVDKSMSENMKLANISRGGVGATILNFGSNAMFTAGIGLEMAAENIIGAGITVATEGAAAPLELGIMARTGARIKTIWDTARNIGRVNKALDAIKDVRAAKDFYTKFGAGAKSIGKLLNPLEHTAAYVKELKDAEKLGEWGKTFKTFGSFYQDARGMNLVRSESALEGSQSSRDLQDKLVAEHYKEFGEMPSGDVAENIYNKAKSAGFNTSLANTLGIFLTNKMMFENSFKGFRSLANTRAEAMKGIEGVMEAGDASWKAKGLKSAFEFRSKSILGGIKTLAHPKTIGKGTLKYMATNLGEGIQESTQAVIQDAASDYYTKLYHSEINGGHGEGISLLNSVGAGLKNQGSGRGLENFASGFFMAGFIQAPQHLLYKYGSMSLARLKDRVGFEKAKAYKKEFTATVENSINELANDPKQLHNSFTENMATQYEAKKDMQGAQESGDKKQFLDIQDEALFNHLYNVTKAGKTEMLKDYFNDMSKLEGKDLQAAFGEQTDDKTIRRKINETVEHLDYLQKRHDVIKEQFKNEFDPNKYAGEKTKKETEVQYQERQNKYITESHRWKAVDDAQKVAIYSAHSFNQTLKRMGAITDKASTNTPLSKGVSGDYTSLFNVQDLAQNVKMLKDQAAALKGIPGSQAEYRKTKEQAENAEDILKNTLMYKHALSLVSEERRKPEVSVEFKKSMAIQVGDRVKTISGEHGFVKAVQGRSVLLSNGKKYKRHRVERLETKGEIQGLEKEHFLHTAEREFYNSYQSYIKKVAKKNDDHVFNEKIKSTFDNLKDFHALDQDSKDLSKAVNVLNDPHHFMDFASILAEVNKATHDKRVENFEAAYKKYRDNIDANALLNDLHDAGYWIDDKGLDKIFKENKLPDNFVSAAQAHTPIPVDSVDYKKAADIVTDYFNLKDLKSKEEPVETTKPTFIQTATGKIRIFRHGETAEDEKGINSGPTQEHITPEGEKHVEDGAEGNVDETLTKIIVSTRQRAIDSAEVVAKKGKDVVVEQNAALDPWNTGDDKTGFAGIPDEDWHKIDSWFALHPEEKVYAGEDVNAEGKPLKEIYADRQSVESFNEFKDRVLTALPEITNALSDGGGIMTHSNVVQLLKAYKENGSKNDGNLGMLFVKNEPSKNGEVIDFQRQEVNPSFAEVKQKEEAAHEAAIEKFDLQGKLDAIKTEDELEALKAEVEKALVDGTIPPVDGWYEYVAEAIEAKNIELFSKIDISTLKKGDVVTLKNSKYQDVQIKSVSSKNGKIHVEGFYVNGLPIQGDNRYITMDDIKYTAHMKQAKTTVTPAEKTLIKTNQEKTTDFTQDVNRLKQVADAAEKKTTAQVTEDFLNNLGCK